MITAHQLEVRVGARLLMENVSFRVGPGDKVGLVGRNGAGKTTLTKVLAGDVLPAAGSVTNTGELGYLPQDPRVGDPDVVVRDRILSARGLDDAVRRMRAAEVAMASDDPKERDKAFRKFQRAQDELDAGDLSGTSLRVILETLDDTELEEAASKWGIRVIPGQRRRHDLIQQILRQVD